MNLLAEYENSALGDVRRKRRLVKLADRMNQEPSASFPVAARDDAALEGTYRFLSNPQVTSEAILAGHYARTAERASAYESVIAIHDTSNFEFGGDAVRKGLGPLRGKGQGFLGHFSLAVGGNGDPLGVVAVQTVTRNKTAQSRRKLTPKQRREDPSTESRRWWKGIEQAEAALSACSVVHVMDREADSYELLARLRDSRMRFVVRAFHDRLLDDSHAQRLSEALQATTAIVERMIPLARRKEADCPRARKIHPARTSRLARLEISATSVSLRRSKHHLSTLPGSLAVNVVHVREVGTNGKYEPVDWKLLTTEPISCAADVERIVDVYRTRWVIEEYFKALKTGCAYEKRQLESKHALLNALAIFIPIAWRLLRMRTLARQPVDEPATRVLTKTQVDVLVATSKRKLPSRPSVRDVLLAVAALGGHIKNNGEPGWIVLGRGYDRLLTMEVAWLAARRTDQS